ncbi:hypothetical protein Pan258_02230 [Symmachiella dynata]|nr:hypothetical protein Pan258_02230 [Symmachiella dynata]
MKIISFLASSALVLAIGFPNWQAWYNVESFRTLEGTEAQLKAASLAHGQYRKAVETAVELHCGGDFNHC